MIRKRSKEVTLLLVSVAFSLLLIEGFIRIFNLAPGVVLDRWDKWTTIVRGPEFKYYQQLNALGLRDHRDFSRTNPSRRVVFLGDSFTFGLGVSNHETFSAIAEATLNACTDRSWTILNAGRSGTGTVRQLEKLKDLLEVIEFNEVVHFYFVGNDPYESLQENRKGLSGGEAQGRGHSKFDTVKSWGFRHLATYRFLKLRLGGEGFLRAVDFTLVDQCDPEQYHSFREHDAATRMAFEEMNSILAARGIDYSVVILPRKEQLTSESFDAFKDLHGVEIPLDRFLPQKRIVEQVLRPLGITYRDLLPELEGRDPDKFYFPVDGHFNPKGHRVVGLLLVGALIERVRAKFETSQCTDAESAGT